MSVSSHQRPYIIAWKPPNARHIDIGLHYRPMPIGSVAQNRVLLVTKVHWQHWQVFHKVQRSDVSDVVPSLKLVIVEKFRKSAAIEFNEVATFSDSQQRYFAPLCSSGVSGCHTLGGWADLGAKRHRVSRGWGMGEGSPSPGKGIPRPSPANYVSGGAL